MSFSAFPFTHTVRHNCALFLAFPIFFFHIFLKSKMLGLDFQVAVFLSLFSKIA